MPIFLLLAGLILIVAGVRGKEKDLLSQVADDGKHFVVWALLIIGVGVLGLSKTWRPVSSAFLVLIVVAFVLGSYRSILQGYTQLINESKS